MVHVYLWINLWTDSFFTSIMPVGDKQIHVSGFLWMVMEKPKEQVKTPLICAVEIICKKKKK